jgi:hypothetical protein
MTTFFGEVSKKLMLSICCGGVRGGALLLSRYPCYHLQFAHNPNTHKALEDVHGYESWH